MSEQNNRSAAAAKIPPQNLDAEKSLLGAILIDEEVLADVSEAVKPRDFYDKNHEMIYDGMLRLYEKHKPVDMLTLTDELKRKDHLSLVGGSAYLSELTNYVPTAAHAEAYADLVSQKAVRRRLEGLLDEDPAFAAAIEAIIGQVTLDQSVRQTATAGDNSTITQIHGSHISVGPKS